MGWALILQKIGFNMIKWKDFFFLKRTKNIMENEENASEPSFFSFSNNVDKKGHFTLYHTMTTFDAPEEKAFWKHCEKRRKMLHNSIFFLSHNVFYPMKNNFNVLSNM